MGNNGDGNGDGDDNGSGQSAPTEESHGTYRVHLRGRFVDVGHGRRVVADLHLREEGHCVAGLIEDPGVARLQSGIPAQRGTAQTAQTAGDDKVDRFHTLKSRQTDITEPYQS